MGLAQNDKYRQYRTERTTIDKNKLDEAYRTDTLHTHNSTILYGARVYGLEPRCIGFTTSPLRKG